MSPVPALSEQELIDGLKTGNKEYFDYVFARYWLRLMFFLGRFTKDKEACEGIVHQVFDSFWIHRKRFTSETNIRHFLYKKAFKISSKRFAGLVPTQNTRDFNNLITKTEVVCSIFHIRYRNNTKSYTAIMHPV
jgi:hypothetical protein